MRKVRLSDIGQPVQSGLLLGFIRQDGRWFARVVNQLTKKITVVDANTLQTKAEIGSPISATSQALINKFQMDVDNDIF